MAKQQTKDATKASNDLINQSKQQNQQFQQQTQQDLDGARQRRNDSYGRAVGGFQDQAATGGFDSGRLASMRENVDNITTTGGYDPTAIAGLRQRLSLGTGGMDAGQVQNLRTRGNAFMDDGGYDAESTAKIRGGYGGFIDNGGFSAEDRTNFLNRGTSGVANTYGVLQQQMQRDQARGGGFKSGGAYGQMARRLSQDQAQSTLDSNVALNEMVNKNKMAGLSGLGGFEGDVAKNRLGAFNTVAGFENDLAAGERDQARTLAGLETDIAGGRRAGLNAGIGLEGQFANNRNQANEGMLNLFRTSSGEVSDHAKNILQSMGLDASTQESAIRSLTDLSKNPGLFQTFLQNAIGLAGAAAGVGGAFGMGGAPKPSAPAGGKP